MKILAFGDLHGDRIRARELAKKADDENVDLVVICGDIFENNDDISNIIGLFKKKVLLVPGNHEDIATVEVLSEMYNAKNLHGYSYKIGDLGLFGCGLSNIGLSALTEEEIHNLLKRGFNYVKGCKKKIMVTHNHPSGTIMEKLSNFIPGSKGVKKALEDFTPDIMLCSHCHEAEGMEEIIGRTKVINVGKIGRIIEI
ncbi:MAG: metallophosphoesterase [Candidatus Woesearchaeota archaeon]